MRVGARIIEVCEILEELGPGGIADVCQMMAPTGDMKAVARSSTDKYCQRAVKMGLLTVDVSPIGNRSHYNVYTVKPEWRQLAKGKDKPAPKVYARPAIKRGVFSFASSIFGLAA